MPTVCLRLFLYRPVFCLLWIAKYEFFVIVRAHCYKFGAKPPALDHQWAQFCVNIFDCI